MKRNQIQAIRKKNCLNPLQEVGVMKPEEDKEVIGKFVLIPFRKSG